MSAARILVPDVLLIPGGVETVARKLLPELAARADRLAYLIPEHRIGGLAGLFPPGAELVPWLRPRHTPTGLLQRVAGKIPGRAGACWRARIDAARVAGEYRRIGGTHLFFACIYDQPFPPRCGPVAGYLFDLNYRHYGESTYDALLREWGMRADHLFFSSASVEREFRLAFPGARARLSVIPLGASPPRPADGAVRGEEGEPLFLFPATFARHKGQLAALRACAALASEGRAFRAVFTGEATERLCGTVPEPDPRREAARAFYAANRALLAGRVECLGYCAVEKLEALFAGARAVVLPSEYEGFGLPLIEAASWGKPVLCSRIGPFQEQVERHGLGDWVRWFDPGDHAAMGREMAAMLDGAGPRAMGPEEAARAAARWTWGDCAERVIRALEEIG